MTVDRRLYVHESNLIEGFDDPVMDACGEAAWAWLAQHDQLTLDVILQLHRVVVVAQLAGISDLDDPGEWVGQLRDVNVAVGGRVCPPWRQVRERLKTWLYDPATTPREQHVAFEKIHPFADGNGRTGRLLMWWHEERLGLTPTLVRYDDRHEYYDWFKEDT